MACPDSSNSGRTPHPAQKAAGGNVPGDVTVILSELNRQIVESRESRRRSPGLLRLPMLLVGFVAMSATVVPWISSLRGAAAVMKAVGATAARAGSPGAKPAGAGAVGTAATGAGVVGSAGSAGAKTADPDLAGLVLNATCITRNQRTAIINGRVYRQKDKIDVPNAANSPYVLAEILPHKVVLECRGKRLPLGYPNTASPDAVHAGDMRDKEAMPPELADAAGDPQMNQFLEKVQKGVAGLEKVMSVLSDGK